MNTFSTWLHKNCNPNLFLFLKVAFIHILYKYIYQDRMLWQLEYIEYQFPLVFFDDSSISLFRQFYVSI